MSLQKTVSFFDSNYLDIHFLCNPFVQVWVAGFRQEHTGTVYSSTVFCVPAHDILLILKHFQVVHISISVRTWAQPTSTKAFKLLVAVTS